MNPGRQRAAVAAAATVPAARRAAAARVGPTVTVAVSLTGSLPGWQPEPGQPGGTADRDRRLGEIVAGQPAD